ncbi:PepSY domain-containing protein [Roseateles koreensis]|uniref:PepSY domain-containing protein n=1 Tax=Roseateles koreensis TaxID=2987526 RepID=A0ABT5KPZ8_9BURK|nr:PepSY domain-containing protein [Roseateles koreensis]MDC8784995.1 PepSY domain-containing protein [Roseateles koreensis]
MTKTNHSLAALLLATVAFGAHAHGDVSCPKIPKEEWRPQMELQHKLSAEGWRIRQVKTFSTCYEVYGFDAKGERVEAFFNPKTFERIEPNSAPEKK